MPCIVIAFCGREIRTAFVSEKDANGDARSEAAASIIAQHRVSSYVVATGPMPEPNLKPTLWEFPLRHHLDLRIQIARFQRSLGSGRGSLRADIMKAIEATTRTVTSPEIDAYLGVQPEPQNPVRKSPRNGRPRPTTETAWAVHPVQLALF